uniref:Exocyst subunit Exo70 family protein n=1 Tax=Cicer arietinum TaxID=3827 RepID=A0A1S2XKF6_CICAR|nr:uncharacterized protein LOC101500706 isoform X2 [Cicer arietinum]
MTPILIQIWRWLMHPKVWRFGGFASAVVGLLCYALSSSFNYLFGEWNLLKIFLYTVFSFIICLVILFARIWRHSRSLRFKAHAAYLALTITSVYSFFFDKVMNGKPDAYSIISCAAFSIMSLSLSRQTQCGFEVDLLYFFLGVLIVQLMKIKLQLFIVGAGFSYSLIILRSSFSSIDAIARADNEYSELQNGSSVVINMNSLQLDSTDIASNSNGINSPQLVGSDFNSMMDQLQTCVKALEQENSNLIEMLLEQIEKYVEEDSQLVVADPNFMMDALHPETIKSVQETAMLMVTAGFEKEFSDVYNNCRRKCLDECLMHKLFRFQKFSLDEVHNMSWQDLKEEIEIWIKASNVALKILFHGERRLCDRVFFGFSSAADFSFMEVCRGSTVQLLNFADGVANGRRSPEHLFNTLKVFETLRDLIPDFESLFCDQHSVSLMNEAITIWKRLGESIRGIFVELENLIVRDSAVTVPGGGLHPITQHVMNYLHAVCRFCPTLEQVFDGSSLSGQMNRIMDQLESNLEEKSKSYEDPSLSYIFWMNNDKYIVEMTKDTKLGTLLVDFWIGKHALKKSQYHAKYQKTMGTIPPTLVQDLFQTTGPFGDVQPLLYSSQQVDEIDGENVKADVHEASPSEQQQMYFNFSQPHERQKDSWTRTIVVVSPAPQFWNPDKMPPDDGFTWKKYGKKETFGFKYPRSYYKCNDMKLYACRAKKQVQRHGVHPNIFEVQYVGGHSCGTSLTIPSLILPPQLVNISRDTTQSSTSPSDNAGLSISKPDIDFWKTSSSNKWPQGEYINSMPKLAVPADGGHHDPMMKTIVISLVSFPSQKEKTIELVECILASESEKYVDPSLRHFFMMNSWRYLEQANKIRDLYDTFGYVWFKKTRSKVIQNLELYQRSSWDKVLEFLKLDINDSVDSMKTKLSMFNMHFKEICRVQCIWSVHDMNLREQIIATLKNILLPAYGIFIGRFQDFLKNKAYDYIEYGMFDIQDILDNMFLGNKKNN